MHDDILGEFNCYDDMGVFAVDSNARVNTSVSIIFSTTCQLKILTLQISSNATLLGAPHREKAKTIYQYKHNIPARMTFLCTDEKV
jgi:hypothetical protein